MTITEYLRRLELERITSGKSFTMEEVRLQDQEFWCHSCGKHKSVSLIVERPNRKPICTCCFERMQNRKPNYGDKTTKRRYLSPHSGFVNYLSKL